MVNLVLCLDKGLPTPTQCDLIKLIWSWLKIEWSMVTLAKLPNPVLTPYTTFLLTIIWSMTALDSITAFQASWLKSIFILPSDNETKFSGVKSWPF